MTDRGVRPRRPLATSTTICRDLDEAALERRPVLEVGVLAEHLADLAAEPAPGALGQRLSEGLDVVESRRHQQRQRGADQQVVDVAAHPLVEPGHLLVVEHRAPVGLEHPRGSRVDHDQAGLVIEVARVAPSVRRRLLVGAVGQLVERLGDVELVVTGVVRDRPPQRVVLAVGGAEVAEVLVDPVGAEARRPPARATSRSPPSAGARSSWCSSRRGCRGRRRSSRWAASTAATGWPGRSTPASRGGRTPRSP